ncbi:MAG: alpha/beta hydrolase [Actinomycetota bacterium]|nr:alpha/beta hydrolase [Actinomycetota bacterium]MDQ6946013.1 alpha/beta hydrolase [Actinomycetota bacterium]
MVHDPGAPPLLPEGRPLELPGRGTTFVREVTGPPGAPVLVLLHGWTATAALNWFPSFDPLGRHFRVLALDHRGHGQGIRSRQPFRLEDCADDVAALAELFGIAQLIPVGYSMGGPIATLMWLRHRSLVQGMVLCATAGRFIGNRPTDRLYAQGMLGLSLAANLSPDGLRRRAMARYVNNRLDGTDLARWAAEELARNDPGALLRAGAALGGFDARLWLPNIDVPTAVIVTEEDRIVPPANQRALAQAIPEAEVFDVAGDHAACVGDSPPFVPVLVTACRRVARRVARRAAEPVPVPLPTTTWPARWRPPPP